MKFPASRRDTDPAPGALTEPADPPAASLDEQPPKRAKRAYYPLRRRGARIREAKRSAYLDAETPMAELAAALDYARSAATTAEEWGMSDACGAGTAIRTAIAALVAAGDALTTAMHTWSPKP